MCERLSVGQARVTLTAHGHAEREGERGEGGVSVKSRRIFASFAPNHGLAGLPTNHEASRMLVSKEWGDRARRARKVSPPPRHCSEERIP